MNLRAHLVSVGAALLLFPSVLLAQPNIILIVADDLRHDAIGRFSDAALFTPNLDGLYGRGFTFLNTYTIGSNSGAVCAPSRAMLLTGRGLGDFWHATSIDRFPSLPVLLREGGYQTFGTGKWHQSRAAFRAGFDEGEEIFFGGCIACSKTSNSHDLEAKRASYNARLDRLQADGSFGSTEKPGVHVTDRFADAAVTFIERQREAFFVYLSFTAPHDPRVAPPEFEALFREEGQPRIELPPNFLAKHTFNQGDAGIRDEVLIGVPRDRDELAEELADYHGMIAHMDAAIGRVLQAVERQKAANGRPTIVLFTSAHGLAIGSHGLLGKQNAYEHSIRAAPLVFSGDGVEPGETAAFVILNDVLPTIAELANQQSPHGIEGQSLVPLIRRQASAVRDEVWYAYKDFQRAIRVGRWKLIRYPHLRRYQLFDLRSDPHELHDLSADPGRRQTIDMLSDRLDAWELRVWGHS